MKHIFQGSVAAAALALLASGAMAQSSTPAPAANTSAPQATSSTPAPVAPSVQGTHTSDSKNLGEIKQTPADKKAEHDKAGKAAKNAEAKQDGVKTENKTTDAKTGPGKHEAKKDQRASTAQSGSSVDKKAGSSVTSEPAKKL